MSGLDLWRFFFPVRVMAYGATGAVGTRLSLRPLFVFFLLRRTVSLHPSGENPPRDRGSVSPLSTSLDEIGCLTSESETDGNHANVLVVTRLVPAISIRRPLPS